MTQPAVGEDEAPVNAPKWTTAGYKGSLKTSVQKYTHRNIASSPEPTAPSTAPVDENPPTASVDEPTVAGPSTSTADVFFLNENILVDDNVLDVEESGDDDKEKSKEDSSSEESSSGEEEDDNNNKGKDKEEEEDDDSSSSEEEEEEDDKGREGNKEEDNKDDEDAKEGDRGISVQSLLND